MIGAFIQTFQVGLKSLLLQKLRAGLAALGIFIGTATVIWLVAMGEGVSYQAQQQIKELGATNIIVRSIKPTSSKRGGKKTDERVQRYGLLRADLGRITSNLPNLTRVVPMRELKREIRYQEHAVDSKLVGCDDSYRILNTLEMARGRWFNKRDDEENVIVLADGTARRLFPHENPIGKSVRVGASYGRDIYTVIGQTQPRAASAAIGGSLDAREYNLDAYIPLSTLRRRIGDFIMRRTRASMNGEIVELSQITVTVDHIEQVDETAAIIEVMLEQFHEEEDYSVVVPKELLRQAERTRMMFNVLLVVIAGISLLVGGIGIMNIMLATVTERTREIGIRRALGATRTHIIEQFLVETVVLTAGGGLLGVGFGLMCKPIFNGVRDLIAALSTDMLPPIVNALEPRVAPWSVGLSLGISLVVGLLSGLYPAFQAAHLDPIEALRHE